MAKSSPDARRPDSGRATRSELDFERGDERSGRVGDPRPPDQLREEFPARRVREAGMTGGETPDGEVTADDLTPETLLDSEPSRTPHADGGRRSADSAMNVVDAARIGAGAGLDEAELAERDPVGTQEARRLRDTSRRHAMDPNMVEPYAARELADTRAGRQTGKPAARASRKAR